MDTTMQLAPLSEARKTPQADLPYPLSSYLDEDGAPRHNGMWPGFGWEGSCVDSTISADAVAAMQWCHDQGFINHTTKNFYNKPLRTWCVEREAKKCAALLAKLGYPL